MLGKIPVEASATVLAASTAVMAATGNNLPTWGIFLGWAAASFRGANSPRSAANLVLIMTTGAVFATAALHLQLWVAAEFAPAGAPNGAVTAITTIVAILVINPCILVLGRTSLFSFIPGMFISFSTVVGASLGQFGPLPGNLPVTGSFALAMNLTGIGFAWVIHVVSGSGSGAGKNKHKRSVPTNAEDLGQVTPRRSDWSQLWCLVSLDNPGYYILGTGDIPPSPTRKVGQC